MNQYNNIREKHGYWEKYHSNGNIWYKGNYINGKLNGYWENYYTNGNIWYTGNYINSKRISNWEYYSYNGTLINKEFYI
jgi:antitoxin component YwqK of YwqJK toxin-antitoxin module